MSDDQGYPYFVHGSWGKENKDVHQRQNCFISIPFTKAQTFAITTTIKRNHKRKHRLTGYGCS